MKNVLVALLGLTPEVITETVYAYSVLPTLEDEEGTPVLFDTIYLLTTQAGFEKARKILLGDDGILARLCRDYDLPRPRLDESTIVILGDDSPMQDIRSSEQGMAIAEQMAGLIQKLTAERDTAIYCSIAGGRKTMGAWLSLVMQVYGRRQDRLSHVLVQEEFEGAWDARTGQPFAYPPKEPADFVNDRHKKIVNSRDARIDLAHIPLLSLGGQGRTASRNFRQALQDAMVRAGIGSPVERVEVDLAARTIRAGDTVHPVASRQWGFYFYLLHRKTLCSRQQACEDCADHACYLNAEDFLDTEDDYLTYLEILDILGLLKNDRPVDKYWRARFGEGGDKDYRELRLRVQEYVSKMNRELLPQSDLPGLPLLEIVKTPRYGETSYGISLDKSRIALRWPDGHPGDRDFLGRNWPDEPPGGEVEPPRRKPSAGLQP